MQFKTAIFISILATIATSQVPRVCHLPEGVVTDARKFVVERLELKAVRPACRHGLKRLLASVANGTTAFDRATLLNRTHLTATCGDEMCPFGELVSALQIAFAEVTDELCSVPETEVSPDLCPKDDKCCQCHEECVKFDSAVAMKKREDEDEDGFMRCVRRCDKLCHDHHDSPSGPAHDSEDDSTSSSGPSWSGDGYEDDSTSSSGPSWDGDVYEDDTTTSSGPSGPADDDHDWHRHSFVCAQDCLGELDLSLTTVLSGATINGCKLLDRAISSTCLEDCSRDVLDLAYEGAKACHARPSMLDLTLDAGEGMCVLGCGSSLSWHTDVCKWLAGEGGECVSGCSDKLDHLRTSALGVCGAGRRRLKGGMWTGDGWPTVGDRDDSSDHATPCEACHEACRPLMTRADDSHPRCEKECEKTVCGAGPSSSPGVHHDRLQIALNDIHAALIRAWDLHDVLCFEDDDHHHDHEEEEDEDHDDEADTGLCIDHLVHLDAAALCERGCASKLFSKFDALLAPFFDGSSSPAAVLEDSLCSRVADASGEHSYCTDLLADIEAATDAERFYKAAPALCLRDESGARPCLEAATRIAGHFDKLKVKGRHALDDLCSTAAGLPGDKTRTTLDTPVTAADELSPEDERDLCDRVAEDVRRFLSDKFGLGSSDVTVIVTIKRSSSPSAGSRLRRLAATGNSYVLSHDILAAKAVTLPSESEIFDSCVKPAVAAAAGVEGASTFAGRSVDQPEASFRFDEGQDITNDGGKKEDQDEDDGFFFGLSKRTVMYGAAGAGVAAIAVAAAVILALRARNRRPRAAARRSSRRLESEPEEQSVPVAVAAKMDVYEKA